MTLAEVERAIADHLARLNRPLPDFQFDRRPQGDATPHVEGDGPQFDWVVSERGIEHQRRTMDGDELVFVAVESLTGRIAQDVELATRGQGYSRATWMDAHARLMTFLRPDWGARVRAGYDATLARHPLTDAERQATRDLDLAAFLLCRDGVAP